MKRLISCVMSLAIVLASTTIVQSAGFTILHSFSGLSNNDGWGPAGGLLFSGSTMYGATTGGGIGWNTAGAVFSMNSNGTAFKVLHTFNYSDGISPMGNLILNGSTLYGTTLSGGGSGGGGGGTVYSVNTDGNGFQTLHFFAADFPYDGLSLNGSWLYGTTAIGGSFDAGTVFKVSTNGMNFSVLHSFTGEDGSAPHGSVTLSGSILYGMSSSNIYKVNTDGTGFQVLNSSTGGLGGLTLDGSKLYGIGPYCGVFSMDTNGGGFQVLHSFSGEDNFYDPQNGLTLVGSILYGVTRRGGVSNKGIIFSVNTNGTGYQILHSFTGGTNDGSEPLGDVTVIDSILYGTTIGGGANGGGIVFSITVPEPSSLILLGMSSIFLPVFVWQKRKKRKC